MTLTASKMIGGLNEEARNGFIGGLPITDICGASEWCGFKGVYVGMSAADVKSKGFNSCSKAQALDEICKYAAASKDFSTFGGEPVKDLEVGTNKGKVIVIGFKTQGSYGGGLEKVMMQKYGKPAVKKGNWQKGYYRWDRRDEFISLTLGNGVNEVSFNVDPTAENERKYKNSRKKAASDF